MKNIGQKLPKFDEKHWSPHLRSQQSPIKINPKRYIPRHKSNTNQKQIIVESWRVNLENEKEATHHTQGALNKTTSHYTMEARRQWDDVFKVLREKNVNQEF